MAWENMRIKKVKNNQQQSININNKQKQLLWQNLFH